jgi:hypothetical protein
MTEKDQYVRDARTHDFTPERFLSMIHEEQAQGYARGEAYDRAVARMKAANAAYRFQRNLVHAAVAQDVVIGLLWWWRGPSLPSIITWLIGLLVAYAVFWVAATFALWMNYATTRAFLLHFVGGRPEESTFRLFVRLLLPVWDVSAVAGLIGLAGLIGICAFLWWLW